ncbi:arginine repressor [Mesoterricola sediminis]|uniref:Arginine repressor n=1 Tax=Mesoterricola sediminis TaxID=2927980 RepID=A0AA48H5D4_9BACT|nr:hypothetical protein [Mesoterricola sediminis]BDU77701.1 arginine repressor [Mesoterricola sediminis]
MEPGKKAIDQAILRITSQTAIPDQATLLSLLAQEGFSLTQGTLSRRLAKLSIRKRQGRYQRIATGTQAPPPYALVPASPGLVVLQTGQGMAQSLVQRLDRRALPGVAGLVAGDDTVLVALQRGTRVEEVQAGLSLILGPPQERV